MKIKVLVIADMQKINVKSYLVDQGTLDVEWAFASFEEAGWSIKNTILVVDKTLYLYDPAVHSIRKEMSELNELMESSIFFKPGEILFVNTSTDPDNQDDRYFTTIMQQHSYQNYKIAASNTVKNLSDVYKLLIGSTKDLETKNTIRSVYRVNRRLKANKAYEAESIQDGVIGVTESKRSQQYEQVKKAVSQTDPRIVFTDSQNKELEKADDINLSSIEISSVVSKRNTYVVVGKDRTGKTTWASALAFSAVQQNSTSLLIDFSRITDATKIYDANGARYKELSVKDLLLLDQKPASNLYVLTNLNSASPLTFLQWFFVEKYALFDSVFVCVRDDFFRTTIAVLAQSVYRVLHCVDAVECEMEDLRDQVELVDDFSMNYVAVNNFFRVPKFKKLLSAEEIKAWVGCTAKVIDSLFFEDLADVADIIMDIG